MKFILSVTVTEKQLTFADVEVNQFFVHADGGLCQKMGFNSYIQITNSEGAPYADYYNYVHADEPIQRILPNVERIEF